MGLRLSLDSSDTESSIGPSCVSSYNRQSPYSPRYSSMTDSTNGNNGSSRAESNRPLEDLLRDLDHVASNENNVLRLLLSDPNRTSLVANRLDGLRSNSVSHSTSTTDSAVPSGSRDGTTPTTPGGGSGTSSSRRYRSRRFTPDSDEVFSGRSRRPRHAVPAPIDVSDPDSDSDPDNRNPLSDLRLMLRHLQLGSPSSRHGQQADSDLAKALRDSAARLSYNVDRLTQNKGECSICLEDMDEGCVIARLPCLCIYHKKCIESWFEHRVVCPEHPGD